MMQNNRKHNTNRPMVRPAVAEQKNDNCKCGCKCDKCCCGSALNGILVFLGCLIIAGAVCYSSCCKCSKKPAPSAFVKPEVAAPVFNDKAITDFIKNNPKVIIDSLNAFYQKQQAQEEPAPTVADKALLDEILNDKTNHVLGNPKGSFVVIEFFDYNCGYCKMMNKKMAEAVKKSKNIRWVVMDAPIFGDRSEIIARYAWAAAKQGKFAEYHAALGETDKKDEDGLKEIGKKLGLNVDKLAKDANSDAAKAKLTANRKYIEKLKINGVPVFIVNGDVRVGAFSDDQMEEYIKQANGGK